MSNTLQDSIDQKADKARLKFQIMVGSAVVVVSFLYGLGAGLSKKVAPALAKTAPLEQFVDPSTVKLPTRLPLPRGVRVSQVGKDVMINNRAADVLSFVSDRGVKSLIEEQRVLWRSRGLTESGMADNRRGVALAFDPKSGTRYTTTIWEVPPTIRKAVSNGMPVQGMIVAVDLQENSTGEGDTAGLSTASASHGEVPGIPTRPGGRGGAIFSSSDPTGRSYSGVYTNPGDIAENLEFYKAALEADGWLVGEANLQGDPDSGIGDIQYLKDGYEASLIFAPSISGDTAEPKTTIIVNLVPRTK